MNAPAITRRLLRADGTSEDLPAPLDTRAIAKMIGASTLSSVVLKHMGRPLHVLMIDDAGDARALPINRTASKLYWLNCIPGTTHPIRGDAVIVPDEDFA